MPEKTLDAVADHGQVTGDTLTGTYADAGGVLDALEGLGISYADVTAQLEREGVEKFDKSWAELRSSVSDELARVASSDSAAEAGQ
jgi:transaldolase